MAGLQLIQDALESQKKVMLLVENEKQLKAQVSVQHIVYRVSQKNCTVLFLQ